MANQEGLVNEEFFEYVDYIGYKIARLNDILDGQIQIPNTIHCFQEYLGKCNSKLVRLQDRLKNRFGSEANETKMCVEAIELLNYASIEVNEVVNSIGAMTQFCEDELSDCREEKTNLEEHMKINYPEKAVTKDKVPPKSDGLDSSRFISPTPLTF